MQIDWFTFGAQIVNFLLLVWLLKRFLYGPIVDAMAEREQRIANRFEEAREQQAAAEEAAEAYRRKQAAFDRTREERLAEVEQTARERKQALMAEARTEVDHLEAQWIEALRCERETFLRDLSQRVGRETLALARRTLRDLADAEVEQQVVRRFADRLRALDSNTRETLQDAVRAASEEGMVIRTAFALSEADREGVTEALRSVVDGMGTPSFEREPGLGMGVEVRVGGHKISWGLDSYVDAMADRLRARIDAVLPPDLTSAPASDEAPRPVSAAPAPESASQST